MLAHFFKNPQEPRLGLASRLELIPGINMGDRHKYLSHHLLPSRPYISRKLEYTQEKPEFKPHTPMWNVGIPGKGFNNWTTYSPPFSIVSSIILAPLFLFPCSQSCYFNGFYITGTFSNFLLSLVPCAAYLTLLLVAGLCINRSSGYLLVQLTVLV